MKWSVKIFKYIYMIISFAYMAGLWEVAIVSIFCEGFLFPTFHKLLKFLWEKGPFKMNVNALLIECDWVRLLESAPKSVNYQLREDLWDTSDRISSRAA